MCRWTLALSSFEIRPSSSLCLLSAASGSQAPSWLAAVMLQPSPSSLSPSSLLLNLGSRVQHLDALRFFSCPAFASHSCRSQGAPALPPFTLPGSSDPLPASLTIRKIRCRARDEGGEGGGGGGGGEVVEAFSPLVIVTPVSPWRAGKMK
eukprot:140388-Hanusia_phi.AAC.1